MIKIAFHISGKEVDDSINSMVFIWRKSCISVSNTRKNNLEIKDLIGKIKIMKIIEKVQENILIICK